MSNCALNFAFANEEESLIRKESACGTLIKPAIDHRMYTVGPVGFTQEQEFLDDEQVRSTASRFSPLKGRKMPGDWNFNSYVKPIGSVWAQAGDEPEHDVLFECLTGAGAQGGGGYRYSLANQLDSFSLWTKKGHTVFAFRGATVEQAEFGISGEAIAGVGWTGKYMEQKWAGTVTAASAATDTVVLPARGTERYTVGMFIFVGPDTNNTAGYEITAVNHAINTLTISPNLTSNPAPCGATPVISPWWPTGGSEVGEPVHGKMGMVQVGGQNCVVLSARVTVVNNIKYYINEKNNEWTAERFGRPKVREIDGELELFFLKPGSSYFYRAEHQVSNAIVIPVGNVAGYIMEISIPYAEYRTPRISGEEEFIQNIPYIAVASASENDEMTITFK
jgi:hypothetical protein